MSSFSIYSETQKWAQAVSLKCLAKATTDSTNHEAKNIAFDESQELLIVADAQTAGRGRGQNTWTSPQQKGADLLATWVFPLNKSPQNLTGPILGLALVNSFQKTWPSLNWSLKAPNDVYLENKKIAGLLIETLNQANSFRLCIGLGINIFDSPKDISTAGHLVSDIGLSQLDDQKWHLFLNQLQQEWTQAVDKVSVSALDVATRESLLKALNANPWLENTLVDVSESGDLIAENSVTKWREI